MNRMEQLTERYHLQAHPEGGAFAEVYTAPFAADGRPLAGSIYFMLVGDDISHFHRIDCDEIWYYHEGGGMRVTLVDEDGTPSYVDLGPDADAGQVFMAVIPKGVIFAAQNLPGADYTFVSCATAPQFQYEGFTLIGRDHLARLCPNADETLLRLAYPGEDRGV